MGRIINKLNLNKTPQNVEDNSLVFAKNIRLLSDGSIGADNSIIPTQISSTGELLGNIVGINNKIYLFVKTENDDCNILEYNELNKETKIINCAWTYSGGQITGCLTSNNANSTILVVCEYDAPVDVPIKYINLSTCRADDDESIYTQTPKIPITNLLLVDKYICPIPNGVYQFFIRYKIAEDFYTNWFPCSKECFAGTHKTTRTIQGHLNYIDTKIDSNESFVFNVEHLFETTIYDKFQIGFIVNNGTGTFARSWKEFDINTDKIYFDYNQNDIQEINIDELNNITYELFNIKNIAYFKNKLYIANYKETDFNPDLQTIASQINVELVSERIYEKDRVTTYDGKNLTKNTLDGLTYYSKLDNNPFYYYFKDKKYTNFQENKRELYTNLEEDYIIATNDPIRRPISTNNHYHKGYVLYELSLVDKDNITHSITSQNLSYKDKTYDPTSGLHSCSQEDIVDSILSQIASNIIGVTLDCKYWIYSYTDDDGNVTYIPIKNINFVISWSTKIRTYEKRESVSVITPENEGVIITAHVVSRKNTYSYNIDLNLNETYLDLSADGTPFKEYNTLIPFTKYNFYIHYVKDNGIFTNGYFIKSASFDNNAENKVIFPTFNNIIIPENYSAYFISIDKSFNIVELFNITTSSSTKGVTFLNVTANCIEADALLYPLNDNIRIFSVGDDNIKYYYYGKYYDSGNNDDLNEFANCGIVKFTIPSTHKDNKFYIEINNFENIIEKQLLKLTPYSKNSYYKDFINLNSPGYFCEIRKLNNTICKDIFISGNDIFNKTITEDNIELIEETGIVDYGFSELEHIHSNFNLNYLSLSDNIINQIRIWKDNTGEQHQQFIKAVNSITSSYILQLESMYKDYYRKYYNEYKSDSTVQFDNTIRSSEINIDEVKRYIYKFHPTAYYNVPTDRGIIINMFKLGDYLYVHNEHTLYVFVGFNSLNTENGQVSLQESDVFYTGIRELFDDKNGYAGLQSKRHSLLTSTNYIFYDSLSKVIYFYNAAGGGITIKNNQVNSSSSLPIPISFVIQKIIDKFDPTDVIFANDDKNNRVFVNLKNNTNDNVCLSYSYLTNSFISIHDFDFNESFDSRNNLYFVKHNLIDEERFDKLFVLDYNTIGYYNEIFKKSYLLLNDVDNYSKDGKFASSIDVITNVAYEKIKNLEYINWICSKIKDYIGDKICLAEEDNEIYPANYVRIYTDQTYTDLIQLVDDDGNVLEQNKQSLTSSNSFKYPRYNCGVWSLNYFRDIKNSPFDVSDNQSLIYGKYIVARFIFINTNFKLENINFKLSNYEKV